VVGSVHLVMQRPCVILKLLSNKKPIIEEKKFKRNVCEMKLPHTTKQA
jgi:hypothetical protein